MFDDLVLHPTTYKIASKYADNLPHALVIDGPSGTGVVSVAKALATHVGSPLFIIEPKKKVKTDWVVDDKEGSVVIDDIRQLYEQTRTRQPGQHVYIINTGEKSMTTAAQNAFLKLLEEPRSGVHFIIASHQPNLLLPTIRSRTQRLSLLPITDDQTVKFVDSLAIRDATQKARLSFVGRGRPALMKRLAEDKNAYQSRVTIMSDAKSMLGSDLYEKMKIIHKYKDSRGDTLTLIDDMNHQLQTIIRKQPDSHIAFDIEKHLKTRDRIAAGGNIRLQLSADVLY
jgi:replication-associated recombination protein RarA